MKSPKIIILLILIGVGFLFADLPSVDAAPTVSFASAQSSGAESSNILIEVVLSEAASDNVTVDYVVTGGTATGNGVDFTLPAGTLLFSPGERSQFILGVIIDDDLDEADETVIVTLQSPSSNASLGSTVTHTYTILDNDIPVASFRNAASEGEESVSSAEIEVVLSNPSDFEVRVNYRVTGGTALSGEDFQLPDGTVTFAPGERSKKINLVIINDNLDEVDETILITLTSAVNAEIGSAALHTYTIRDNDAVRVSFKNSVSSEYENVPTIKMEVILSVPSDKEVSVNYSVSGTATNDVDYHLPDGILKFNPGETSKNIFAAIINDAVYEPDETIIVTLSNPVNAVLGRATTHLHWIIDDDGPTENITLFKQELDTNEEGKKLVIIGPKTLTINPRGMAIDKSGNLYISDQGPSKGEKEGSILMWPKGKNRVLRIITGLTRPGDVELSPDQKKLIVAGPKGDIYRLELGLSIRIANIDPFAGNTRVHLISQATGEKVAKVSPDGYFHIPGLLVPNQQVELFADIEYGGKTKRFSLTLGQPGEPGEPYGHTVIDLNF
jgi:hypothetical protein